MTVETAGEKGGIAARGEAMAADYLLAHGFTILERNFRYGRGEIDIIAREGETLVFCEVKLRRNDQFGPPEYAVTPKKQHQIRHVALGYFFRHNLHEQECRFDVVAIHYEHGEPVIHHIRNAF